MLVPNSSRLHPEFDLAAARGIFIGAGVDKDLDGELITSPHDLFSVETLRDANGLRTGRVFPTDVFVFGKGEAPRRECTKVGGMPYWPADRLWPTNPAGEPYRFLAQFNFADSRDLFPNLDGDVLLLLVENDPEWIWEPNPIRFEWLPMGVPICPEFDASLFAEQSGPFFGVVYRSADYPDCGERARASDVSQSYNLPILNGTKIGGLPHFIESHSRYHSDTADDLDGEFLCQLGSIQAAPNVPFPWVNQSDPLALEFDEGGIHGPWNEISFGDMGSIYVFRGPDGTIKSLFECY
jgi:hypothetical protein